MIALYPIKPKYIDKIFSGQKTFELRRRLPKKKPEIIILYSTAPVSMIVGYATIRRCLTNSLNGLWEKVCKKAGVTQDEYDKYFIDTESANALEMGTIYKFAKPFKLIDLKESMVAPQSFCYIDHKDFIKIKKRKTTSI